MASSVMLHTPYYSTDIRGHVRVNWIRYIKDLKMTLDADNGISTNALKTIELYSFKKKKKL